MISFAAKDQKDLSIPGISLFSGIGGFELGMEPYGHKVVMFCEIEPSAQAVLRAWKPTVRLHKDVQVLDELPQEGRVLVAGFPCTDMSLSGRREGIFGEKSGLVRDVFRLLKRKPVEWVILENVPDLITLGQAVGIRYVTEQLESLGYRWAYRVVDSKYFGVPHRRRRVYIVASLSGDPREVLLSDNAPEAAPVKAGNVDIDAHDVGFYWSEGKTGLGLMLDGVPPLKASDVRPCILFRDGRLMTTDIRDAERLQALPADWTRPGEMVGGSRGRWQLVGNAVTRTVPNWIASRMESPVPYIAGATDERFYKNSARWPKAAWNMGEGPRASTASENPLDIPQPKIAEYLQYPMKPLSLQATEGFLNRAKESRLTFPPRFLERVEDHWHRMYDLAHPELELFA